MESDKVEQKKFACNCGLSYDRNSSLFNHIRLKHNNDKKGFAPSQKVGRPTGVKNSGVPKLERKIAKEFECKCGKVLKGEGSLSNHIKLKHKNEDEYRIQKKQQGRRPKSQCAVEEVKIALEEEDQQDKCQSICGGQDANTVTIVEQPRNYSVEQQQEDIMNTYLTNQNDDSDQLATTIMPQQYSECPSPAYPQPEICYEQGKMEAGDDNYERDQQLFAQDPSQYVMYEEDQYYQNYLNDGNQYIEYHPYQYFEQQQQY